MSIRGCWRLGVLALVLLSPPAVAQVNAEVLPNVDSLDEAAKRIESGSCRRVACKVTVLLDRAVQLEIEGASATVGRPHPLPRDRDAREARSHRALVAQARRVAPEVCRQAAELLSRYGAQGVPSEVVVPVAVLDLASRLDGGVDSPSCIHAVIRAMPTTSAAVIAIHNTRALCTSQRGAGRCAGISR